MTNNEAIGILAIVVETAKGRCFVTDEAISDAYAMAISALQAQEAKAQLSAEGTTSDLISRQAAIDRINKQREHLQPGIYPQDKIGDAAYRICAEFIERLPSAQPEIEERTEKFAQNVPKEDLISRKAAIDAIEKNAYRHTYLDQIIDIVSELPSSQPEVLACGEGVLNVQPEIVRCKDCKYCDRGIDEDGNPFLKCLGWVYGGTQEEDFCSHAERRTDAV